MPTAVERIDPTRWSLAGSVLIGPFEQPLSWMTFQTNSQLLQTRRSLTVIHRFGPLSSQIRSAMLKKTILPKVEIHTPNGLITLTNAQIVARGLHLSNHPTGGSTALDTHDLERISFVYSKLTAQNLGAGDSSTDDLTGDSK